MSDTGCALSRWTTLGGSVLERSAHATWRPAWPSSSLSGNDAILRRSAATTSVTPLRWSWMNASSPTGKGSEGLLPSASPSKMRRGRSSVHEVVAKQAPALCSAFVVPTLASWLAVVQGRLL